MMEEVNSLNTFKSSQNIQKIDHPVSVMQGRVILNKAVDIEMKKLHDISQAYGSSLAMGLMIERTLFSQIQRVPGIASSNHGFNN